MTLETTLLDVISYICPSQPHKLLSSFVGCCLRRKCIVTKTDKAKITQFSLERRQIPQILAW